MTLTEEDIGRVESIITRKFVELRMNEIEEARKRDQDAVWVRGAFLMLFGGFAGGILVGLMIGRVFWG